MCALIEVMKKLSGLLSQMKKNLSPFINCLKRQNCDHTLEESPDTSRKKINQRKKKKNHLKSRQLILDGFQFI